MCGVVTHTVLSLGLIHSVTVTRPLGFHDCKAFFFAKLSVAWLALGEKFALCFVGWLVVSKVATCYHVIQIRNGKWLSHVSRHITAGHVLAGTATVQQGALFRSLTAKHHWHPAHTGVTKGLHGLCVHPQCLMRIMLEPPPAALIIILVSMVNSNQYNQCAYCDRKLQIESRKAYICTFLAYLHLMCRTELESTDHNGLPF